MNKSGKKGNPLGKAFRSDRFWQCGKEQEDCHEILETFRAYNMDSFADTGIYRDHAGLPSPARVEQAAWWGGLYPEYCLPGAMEKVEAEQEAEEEEESVPVKIRFKYLTFLND